MTAKVLFQRNRVSSPATLRGGRVSTLVLSMAILTYILGRLGQMVLVVLGVTLIAFLTIQLVPGDPVRIMLHGRATDEVVAAAHARLGLDQPLLVQFANFFWNALQGDLGTSIIQKAPVTQIVGERLEASVFLLSYGALIAVVIALPLALLAASHRDRPLDHAIRIGGMIGFAMPPFLDGAAVDAAVRPDPWSVSNRRLRQGASLTTSCT